MLLKIIYLVLLDFSIQMYRRNIGFFFNLNCFPATPFYCKIMADKSTDEKNQSYSLKEKKSNEQTNPIQKK